MHSAPRTIIGDLDLTAVQAWTNSRYGPAYMRGIPTWVWQSALSRRQRHSGLPGSLHR